MDILYLRMLEAENMYAMGYTKKIFEDFAKRLLERKNLLKKSCIQR